MDSVQPVAPPFLPAGTDRDGLRLRSTRDFPGGPLLVHCRGIEVGALAEAPAVAAGGLLTIPIVRLPRVPLPTELRLSGTVDGPDLCPPIPIESAATALALLGPPAVTVEDLRLDHGILRGTVREPRNGLIEPMLFARINGSAARVIQAEEPMILPEGGCAFRFALPLLPVDLTEAGVAVDVFLVGQDAPIARYALARADAGETARRLAALEARLDQVGTEAEGLEARLADMLRRRMDLQQERIDAFIEAAAILLVDRLAGSGTADAAAPDALRALIGQAMPPPQAAQPSPAEPNRIVIEPDARHFGDGWHMPEADAQGPLRWMTAQGFLANPAPRRSLAGITLDIVHLYGAGTPALAAEFDSLPTTVEVSPLAPNGFRVAIAPTTGPGQVRMIRLTSAVSGVPAHDNPGGDPRTLAFAVARVAFDYST